jgi:hypothetical protein
MRAAMSLATALLSPVVDPDPVVEGVPEEVPGVVVGSVVVSAGAVPPPAVPVPAVPAAEAVDVVVDVVVAFGFGKVTPKPLLLTSKLTPVVG